MLKWVLGLLALGCASGASAATELVTFSAADGSDFHGYFSYQTEPANIGYSDPGRDIGYYPYQTTDITYFLNGEKNTSDFALSVQDGHAGTDNPDEIHVQAFGTSHSNFSIDLYAPSTTLSDTSPPAPFLVSSGSVYSFDAYYPKYNFQLPITAIITTVPELSTWLLMIVGFGFVGGSIRRAMRKSDEAFTAKVRAQFI